MLWMHKGGIVRIEFNSQETEGPQLKILCQSVTLTCHCNIGSVF